MHFDVASISRDSGSIRLSLLSLWTVPALVTGACLSCSLALSRTEELKVMCGMRREPVAQEHIRLRGLLLGTLYRLFWVERMP